MFEQALGALTVQSMVFSTVNFVPTTFHDNNKRIDEAQTKENTPSKDGNDERRNDSDNEFSPIQFRSIEKPQQVKKMSYCSQMSDISA